MNLILPLFELIDGAVVDLSKIMYFSTPTLTRHKLYNWLCISTKCKSTSGVEIGIELTAWLDVLPFEKLTLMAGSKAKKEAIDKLEQDAKVYFDYLVDSWQKAIK